MLCISSILSHQSRYMRPSRKKNNTKTLNFINITEIGEAQVMMEMSTRRQASISAARYSCYAGVLRAGAPPAMLWRTRVLVTRREATVERWMGAAWTTRDLGGAGRRRTGPNRRRVGAGGTGADPGDNVYPEYWRCHLSDDGGDTPRASGHCMCDIHMHMYRYDRAEVVLTLFRSIRFQRCR